MDIRLIALDLVGTLLTTDKRLTEHTKKVLARAAEQGIHIVPATGRSVTGLAPEVRGLPFVRYAITVNGAAVWDMDEERIVSRKAFSPEQARELWNFIQNRGAMLDASVDGVCRLSPDFYERINEFMPDEPRQRLIRSTRTPTENLTEMVTDGKHCIEKFNVFFPITMQAERQKLREELEQFGYLAITSSLGNNLELNHREATKGNGLLSLAKELGLMRIQTMAFGDGENDISMLKAAGAGVAMGNASEIVKQAADLVTKTNDEDGVAYIIETRVLQNR